MYADPHSFSNGLKPFSSFLGSFLSSLWFLGLSQVQESPYYQLPPNIKALYTFYHIRLHTVPSRFHIDDYYCKKIWSRVSDPSSFLHFPRYTLATYLRRFGWFFLSSHPVEDDLRCWDLHYSYCMMKIPQKTRSKLRVSIRYDTSRNTMQLGYF